MSISLYIYTADHNLTLLETIHACQDALTSPHDCAYALLYTPQCCCWARMDASGALTDAHGRAMDTAEVFEARLFNAIAELRWLHRGAGRGHAAVLSEEGTLTLFAGRKRREEVTDCISQRYLLWGQGTGTSFPTGWSQLGEARIGAFLVPIGQVARHGRVQLTAVEYLKTYQYDNVGVCEERLTGFVIADKEQANG